MQEYMFILPVLLFLLFGVMSPGPSFILVAQIAMARSRREAVAASIGMGVGASIFALIAAAGLLVVIETVPWIYTGLKVIGGSYLCFLAFKMWRNSNESLTASMTNNSTDYTMVKMFLSGLLTQLSNPKTAIVFGSVFAAFLPKEVPEYSFIILSALALLIDSLWYALVATLLSTAKAQMTYLKFKKYICRVAGVFMGMLGAKLIVSQ